ncbi:hypothetical protein BD779DRAFT_1750158 [Infundibulicybe gibba]|nr:hypothetical protein BD779DRAFT_1750158 [Infundibulicybe gibba]
MINWERIILGASKQAPMLSAGHYLPNPHQFINRHDLVLPQLDPWSLFRLQSVSLVMTTLEMVELNGNHADKRHCTIIDMPVEILLKFFVLCLGVEHRISEGSDWDSSEANPLGFNSGQAPLLLTKVCRLWRAVSLSTQHFWVVLPYFGAGRILPGSGTDKLFRISLAIPHLHRVGKLRIMFAGNMGEPSRDSLGHLFTDHRGMFKLLTHLQLVSGSWTPIPRSPCLNAFEGAPLLKSVCLSHRANLPWSQIEHFRGYVPDIGDISDTLLLCTRLETLDFSDANGPVKHSSTRASIFLPKLRKIRLTNKKGASHKLLSSLHAPLLEVIEITDICHTSPIPSALIACTAQSHCSGLTSLRLLCTHLNADELRQLSSLAPGLQELDMFPTPDALRALMFSPTRNNILPCLMRLTVHDVEVHDQELIDICQSCFSSDLNGEGEYQVEPLQYCEIYPCGGRFASRGAAQQLWDVAESFQDNANFRDILNRLQLLNRGVTTNMDPGSMHEISSTDVHSLEDCFDFLEKYEIVHPLLLKWEPFVEEYDARLDAQWSIRRRAGGWRTLVYHSNIKGCFKTSVGRGHGKANQTISRDEWREIATNVLVEILSEIFVQCLAIGLEGRKDKFSEASDWYHPQENLERFDSSEPPLLLAKFAEGSDWYGPQANPKGFNSNEAPLLLTKVCKLWRTISLSTQQLWTVLPRLGVGPILPDSGTDKLFHMYLTHSGSVPLSIRILIQTAKWNDYTAALLSSHFHRAGQLRIAYARMVDESSSHSLDRLFADHRGMFKSLTHLRITSHELRAMPQPPFLDAFEDAPLLKNVSLICLSRKVNLPWSQIKHYHCHVYDIGDVSDILLPCTQLETLDLCAKQIYRGDHSDTQASIFLPRLRRLRLMDGKWTNHRFFGSLHAPLLEAVQIDDVHHTSPVPLSALTTCIVQSYCIGLSSLQLLCSHIHINELLQISRLVPRLQELDMLLTPDAFRALACTPTGNNIFLHLTRLTIRDVRAPNEYFSIPVLSKSELCGGVPEYGSRRAARQLQDMAESFQDDAGFRKTLDRLWQLHRGKIGMVPDGMSEDLEDCFEEIETYEITHPLLLKRHKFPMIVGDISRGSPIPPHIRLRASALLAKWGPLLNEYNARDRRWFLQGREDYWYTLVCSPNIEGGFRSKFTTTDYSK